MTDEQIQRIETLHLQGKKYTAIARELGISPSTARYHGNPQRKGQQKMRANEIVKMARKFYWFCKRVHPDILAEFLDVY